MKNKTSKTCLFLTLAAILIITSTANMTTASSSSNIQITNLSGTATILSSADLLNMPKTTVEADLSCYGLSVATGEWGGVKLSDLLTQAGLDPAVASVAFKAQDGYIVAISLNTAMRSDVIIAYELEGIALSEGLRLVVPDTNGDIWIAQITQISMSSTVVEKSIGQSGAPANPVSGPYTTEPQTTPQQQQLPTPSPTSTPKNQPANKPLEQVPTPANLAPTNTDAPNNQNSKSQSDVSSVDVGYGVGLLGFVMVLAAGLLLYRRRK